MISQRLAALKSSSFLGLFRSLRAGAESRSGKQDPHRRKRYPVGIEGQEQRIPSRGGRSHRPDEQSDWRAIERGANVLLHTLLELAG